MSRMTQKLKQDHFTGPVSLVFGASSRPPDSLIRALPGRASLPGPDLIGRFCQQFGLLINRVAALAASFGNLAMGGEGPVHRADPAKIAAFIEQGCVDLGRGPARKARGPQLGQAPDHARFLARLFQTARAVTVPAIFPPEVALSAPHDADAHWRATPPVLCRWLPSIGCPGSKPPAAVTICRCCRTFDPAIVGKTIRR